MSQDLITYRPIEWRSGLSAEHEREPEEIAYCFERVGEYLSGNESHANAALAGLAEYCVSELAKQAEQSGVAGVLLLKVLNKGISDLNELINRENQSLISKLRKSTAMPGRIGPNQKAMERACSWAKSIGLKDDYQTEFRPDTPKNRLAFDLWQFISDWKGLPKSVCPNHVRVKQMLRLPKFDDQPLTIQAWTKCGVELVHDAGGIKELDRAFGEGKIEAARLSERINQGFTAFAKATKPKS